MTQTHELKTWPMWFEKILDGTKTFELRKEDRNYREGDLLCLREWDPETEKYTGREINKRVLYVMESPRFLRDGYCAMSLGPDL